MNNIIIMSKFVNKLSFVMMIVITLILSSLLDFVTKT